MEEVFCLSWKTGGLYPLTTIKLFETEKMLNQYIEKLVESLKKDYLDEGIECTIEEIKQGFAEFMDMKVEKIKIHREA
jgi:hypothetical protein